METLTTVLEVIVTLFNVVIKLSFAYAFFTVAIICALIALVLYVIKRYRK